MIEASLFAGRRSMHLKVALPRATRNMADMKRFTMIVTLVLFMPAAAHAFCSAPRADQSLSAPQPPGDYDKPRAPDCLSRGGYGGAGDCDGRQIDDYRRAMDRYAGQLDEFSRRAEEFSNKAARFAEEATQYAACEARELERR